MRTRDGMSVLCSANPPTLGGPKSGLSSRVLKYRNEDRSLVSDHLKRKGTVIRPARRKGAYIDMPRRSGRGWK